MDGPTEHQTHHDYLSQLQDEVFGTFDDLCLYEKMFYANFIDSLDIL